jgi:hypothetical protein
MMMTEPIRIDGDYALSIDFDGKALIAKMERKGLVAPPTSVRRVEVEPGRVLLVREDNVIVGVVAVLLAGVPQMAGDVVKQMVEAARIKEHNASSGPKIIPIRK